MGWWRLPDSQVARAGSEQTGAMDDRAYAGIAVVGSIALTCWCVVWWVYAEFPTRDEHLFAERAGDRVAARRGVARAAAPLWIRLSLTTVCAALVVVGVVNGAPAVPLIVACVSTGLMWVVRPRTAHGRRSKAAGDRASERW